MFPIYTTHPILHYKRIFYYNNKAYRPTFFQCKSPLQMMILALVVSTYSHVQYVLEVDGTGGERMSYFFEFRDCFLKCMLEHNYVVILQIP